jgi:hypothetical protein
MLRLKNMPDQSHLSPALAAMMCDGMGWFSPLDYKRMLLAYDRIYYLLPSTTVEFEDVGGARQSFYSSTQFKQNPLFEIWHDVPEATVRDLIFAAARPSRWRIGSIRGGSPTRTPTSVAVSLQH